MEEAMRAISRSVVVLAVATMAAAAAATVPANAAALTFNVRDFGAKGNGKTLDDGAIDKAITAASAAPGGIVVFPSGTYLSRTIHLKSNITLQLNTGSTIKGAASGYDAPEPNAFAKYQDFGHSHFHNALLFGDKITNLTITGTGTIDGAGLVKTNTTPKGQGDKLLSLTRCANVTLRTATFRHGGHFAVLMNGCHDVLFDHFNVLSSEARDRDGVNLVNTWNVEVSHSTIQGTDDGLSFKSDFALGQTFPSHHLRVHDSTILSTKNNAIQFGVESCGDFSDAVFTNDTIPGAGKAGIGIVSLDGGHLSDIHFTGITETHVSSPVFIRLGGRGSCPGTPPPGSISNVSIDGLTGTHLSTPLPVQGAPEYASTIVGSPGADITDVSLSNVDLTVPGGHPVADAGAAPPEGLSLYRPREFGTRPAYGFWLRHVTRVTFTNTVVRFEKSDGRPAYAVDDGSIVRWLTSKMQRSGGPVDVRVTNVNGYQLLQCTTLDGALPRVKATNSVGLP
jgi:polygalacturonase